ncbi:MAG: carotenoid 1,2-hydratase [Planctomycetaceae bacterium]|nr:carotenoid 1,2-hydratase [Planctomycetaceae bacterium]
MTMLRNRLAGRCAEAYPSLQELPRRRVELPGDLFAHDSVKTEWWYYSGHLFADGRTFGFHLAFFRRRSDGDRIGRTIPVEWFFSLGYLAHFALSDLERGVFRFEHRRSHPGAAGADRDRYRVWIGDWSAEQRHAQHELAAAIEGVRLNLSLTPVKPVVLHGEHGFWEKAHGRSSFHFSYPRMSAEGTLCVEGRRYNVHGTAWMDREFGDCCFNREVQGWDAFCLQFDDGREMMIYLLLDDAGGILDSSHLTLIQKDGSRLRLSSGQFSVNASGRWVSPATGLVYPQGWRVRASELSADFDVTPALGCEEVDTRGSTSTIYWEGPATVSGRMAEEAVSGRAYVELAGYDRARGRFRLYDFRNENIGLVGFLVNEARWQWGVRGGTLRKEASA